MTYVRHAPKRTASEQQAYEEGIREGIRRTRVLIRRIWADLEHDWKADLGLRDANRTLTRWLERTERAKSGSWPHGRDSRLAP